MKVVFISELFVKIKTQNISLKCPRPPIVRRFSYNRTHCTTMEYDCFDSSCTLSSMNIKHGYCAVYTDTNL